MKNIKYLFTFILFVMTLGLHAQEVNRLEVQSVIGAAGKDVNIPIALTNDNEIVAVQFNLHLPFQKAKDDIKLVSNRSNGHVVSCRALGGNVYTVVVVSMENRPLKGNSGNLLNVPMSVDERAQAGDNYDLGITDVVLSLRNGKNIATESVPGKYTVKRVPTPDLIVENVKISVAEFAPEETISLNWSVKNVGNEVTGDGWKENLYLQSPNGEKVYIGEVYSQAKLAAGVSLPRSATIKLPRLIGIDGEVHGVVQLVSSFETGELETDQLNNTGISTTKSKLARQLFLKCDQKSINEGENTQMRLQLSRSGFRDMDERFIIQTEHNGRLQVPQDVVLPKGKSGVYFYASAVNNNVSNDYLDEIVLIPAQHEYNAISQNIEINDDELLSLHLSTIVTEVTEGEHFDLKISRERTTTSETVYLTCEKPTRFSFPGQVEFVPGEKEKTVTVNVLDDNLADMDHTVGFYATATQYTKVEQLIVLKDNDVPDIDLELAPTTVNENAGLNAIMATLRRTSATNSRIVVKLTDNSAGKIHYSTRTIVLEKGMTEAQFSLGIVDNAVVEPIAEYELTAAVYIASCDCSSSTTSKGIVTKKITVVDDDGPSLSLSTESSMIQEGSNTTTNLVVRHNISSSKAIVVQLSSEDSYLDFQKVVTIPAGSQEVKIPLKAKANQVEGDSRTVVIKAVSDSFNPATCWLMVSDQTLPDAYIVDLAVNHLKVETEGEIIAKVEVGNLGMRALPIGTEVSYYLDNNREPLAVFELEQAIEPHAGLKVEHTLRMPKRLGDIVLKAKVNAANKVKECIMINNESKPLKLKLEPSYTATVTIDKEIVSRSQPLIISGVVSGSKVSEVPVEIYLINNGVRTVLNAVTDQNGKYELSWIPDENQMGLFEVGACYPGEGLRTAMAEFNIYGLRRVGAAYIQCENLAGQAYEGAFTIENPSNLSLNNVRVEVLEAPASCHIQFDRISLLKGQSRSSMVYHLKDDNPTTGMDWEIVKLRVLTDEGASFDVSMYYYCRSAEGQLDASTKQIETTMIKGESRDYSLAVTNIGKGATGQISLSIPENQKWLSVVTPSKMASLEPGESTTIIFRMTPTDDMPLNVPTSLRIGINTEKGTGLPITLRSEVVSGKTGTLLVDVCDENTYYTEAAPHLAGAQVVVKHPVTGALITQGLTGADGTFKIDLPEGYYSVGVTADHHDSFRSNVLVDPGKVNKQVVNLSFEAIKVSWDVKETEVEDVYDIVTTVKYETHFPVPVIETILPDRIPIEELKETGSCVINGILTNKGLITAKDVSLTLGESQGVEYEYLIENGFTLAPSQSVIVPIRIKLAAPEANVANSLSTITLKEHTMPLSCMLDAFIDWMWDCGPDHKRTRTHYPLQLEHCINYVPTPDVDKWKPDPSEPNKRPSHKPSGPRPPVRPQGPYDYPTYDWLDWNIPDVKVADTDCDPCLSDKMKTVTKCGVRMIPIVEKVLEIEKIFVCTMHGDIGCIAGEIIPQPKYVEKITGYAEKVECVAKLLLPCEWVNNMDAQKKRGAGEAAPTNAYGENLPSYMVNYLDVIKRCDEVAKAEKRLYLELMGDECWLNNIPNEAERVEFGNAFQTWQDEGMLNADLLRNARPSTITEAQMEKFIQRWDNTINGVETDNNYIDANVLAECTEVFAALKETTKKAGYPTMVEWYRDAERTYAEEAKGNSGSVCSTITLQINQTMAMTRQAFLGTLTVYNGHETLPMKDVKLTLEVTNDKGDLATSHEMQINLQELSGFTGAMNMVDGWTLNGRETGVATIQFIPTKYAAPEIPVEYSFGGTLSYTDPYTGLTVVRDLYPVQLTVKPSPVLDMTYFMQRDIQGDNTLTKDVVEPMVPAEFSVLITNKGYGDAKNVSIMTQQPQITENEKGALIDFEILSSQVNGQSRNLALGGNVNAEVGTIPANSSTYVQWLLQCNYLGHFVDYDIKATHVTSFGNKDLSLLDKVTIHELIRSLQVPQPEGEPLVGFLVNDIVDAYDTPDAIYLSDARVENVIALEENAMILSKSGLYEWNLNLHPEKSAWHYGHITDPSAGRAKLVKVVRKRDGVEMPLQNFWQTTYTLKDGKEPLQENLIHFADQLSVSAEGENYLLVFEPHPDVSLEVSSFDGLQAEKNLHATPVKNVKVSFNKPVKEATFTSEDLKLTCQGKEVLLNNVNVKAQDNSHFDIIFGNETAAEGYYVLSVQTKNITDTEGYNGQMGKNADWIYFEGGLLRLTAQAYPREGGQVSIVQSLNSQKKNLSICVSKAATSTGIDEQMIAYDEPVQVVAEPAPGYVFKGWYLGDKQLSTDGHYTVACLDHTSLRAEFVPSTCKVKVAESRIGQVMGAGSGVYDYGSKLKLTAVAASGYALSGWMVNGKLLPMGNGNTLELAVTENMEVSAVFTQKVSKNTLGDVNADNLMTVYDVEMLRNYVLGKPAKDFHPENADVNEDGIITIVDSEWLINIILKHKQ